MAKWLKRKQTPKHATLNQLNESAIIRLPCGTKFLRVFSRSAKELNVPAKKIPA